MIRGAKAEEMNTVSRYDRMPLASRYTRNYKVGEKRSPISLIEIATRSKRQGIFDANQIDYARLANENETGIYANTGFLRQLDGRR